MGKNIDLDDYSASRKIVQNEKLNSNEYDKVYYMTNEDLVDVYSDMDFRGKDVLSVLASSDQVLTARFLDAKTVDAFDKNAQKNTILSCGYGCNYLSSCRLW